MMLPVFIMTLISLVVSVWLDFVLWLLGCVAVVFSVLYPIHTTKPDLTKQSCLFDTDRTICRVWRGSVN